VVPRQRCFVDRGYGTEYLGAEEVFLEDVEVYEGAVADVVVITYSCCGGVTFSFGKVGCNSS